MALFSAGSMGPLALLGQGQTDASNPSRTMMPGLTDAQQQAIAAANPAAGNALGTASGVAASTPTPTGEVAQAPAPAAAAAQPQQQMPSLADLAKQVSEQQALQNYLAEMQRGGFRMDAGGR